MSGAEYDEVSDLRMERPHVVILGAGASLAALPNGDKNGKPLPLMNDLVDLCDLQPILERNGISHQGVNFEEIYSNLFELGDEILLGAVEETVFEYFFNLQLPDYPTIYDHLVTSLRPKDLIATFNWDPLLWQALARNHEWAEGPQAVFLHGNSAIGFCLAHKKMGPRGARCGECGSRYTNTKLLYPIKVKDYATDPFISACWSTLRNYLRHAFVLTIFGYGAPESDVEAVRLLQEAWGPVSGRSLEQTEIIDIRDEDELRRKWRAFIHTHHYEVHDQFSDSIVARHPRRSCEAMQAQLMECVFLDNHKAPDTSDWGVFRAHFKDRLEAERRGGNA